MGNDPPARGRVRALLSGVLAVLSLVGVLLGTGLLLAASPASAQEGGEGVRGILQADGEPLAGVTVLAEQDGEEVASAESSDDGRFLVELPGPGVYTISLDTGTLPEGVEPRVASREIDVRPGAVQPALFQFGEDTRTTSSRLDRLPQLVVNGLQYGLVIAMASIGLSLIFGTTGLTNFAHGELVTGGALLGYAFNVGLLQLNLIVATVVAVVVGGVLGGLLDRGLWRPLRRRGTGLIAALVVSIGLALLLRFLYLYFFGGATRSYRQYAVQAPLEIGPVLLPPRDLVLMGVSILALVLVGLALQRTRIGKATRAVADNPSLAASSGIDVERVINAVWVVGSALAVLGGVFLALTQGVGYQLGQNILLVLFAAVTLGGLGTAYGALVGALVIGMLTQVSTLFIAPELQNVGALLALIVILVVRPQGILGRRERVG